MSYIPTSFRGAPYALIALALLALSMTAHKTHAQNVPSNLDITAGSTIQIRGQPGEPGSTDAHTFALEDWTDIEIRLEAAGDVSAVLWHLSANDQIAAPGDYVVAGLGEVDGLPDAKRLTLRSGRYAIVIARQSGAAGTYMLTIKASQGKRPPNPIIIDLDVIDGDLTIVSDWIGTDEHQRQYLITTVQPVQLAVLLTPSDATASLALHAADNSTLLGRATASAIATGEVRSFVSQGTYRISVIAPSKELSYDLTISAVAQ